MPQHNHPSTQRLWWHDHDNIVLLAHHMADTLEPAEAVADMIEKPWKFEDEWKAALEANR